MHSGVSWLVADGHRARVVANIAKRRSGQRWYNRSCGGKECASKLFDRLDYDHDGTLDKRELRGRLSAKDFAAADPDKDGTLDKDEFLAVVEARFKAANRDSDDTMDAKELASSAGRSLSRLLK